MALEGNRKICEWTSGKFSAMTLHGTVVAVQHWTKKLNKLYHPSVAN